MKRLRKILVRGAVVLFALLLLAVIFSLDGVDRRTYFRQPYYQQTVARLRAAGSTNEIARGELFVGYGQALLTPTINAPQDEPAKGQFRALPLSGYGDRQGRPATGVHDDLFIKAVAVRVGERIGVMLGADALIIPREVTDLAMQRIESELKLSRAQVYLSATHTHCSLGAWGEGLVAEAFAGGYQAGARVWFADRIVSAIRDAVADLKPASFGHNRFNAPEFIRNRLVGSEGRVDPEFSYAVFQQSGGKRIVMGSFSAHATVLGGSVMEFSGDYPGVWQRVVEKATGGAAVFLAGGVGSHSPVSGGKGFEGVTNMGNALATRLIAQLPQTSLTNWLAFGLLGLDVTMPPLNVRVSDNIRLRPWLAKQLMPVQPESYLQAFRLNDSLWISTPCDFSGELALDMKDFTRARGAYSVVTSFNGDYVGYVICPRYYSMNGYEPRVMSFFGPNVPDYFCELMRGIAVELTE